MRNDSREPDALPTERMAYTIAGDTERGWTMLASGLTFDEALALTHALNTIMRARKTIYPTEAEARTWVEDAVRRGEV